MLPIKRVHSPEAAPPHITGYNMTASTSFFSTRMRATRGACWHWRQLHPGLDLWYQADHHQPGSGCLNGDLRAFQQDFSASQIGELGLLNGELCRTTSWHYVLWTALDIGATGHNNTPQCEYFSLLMMNRSGLEQSVVRTGLWPESWAEVANQIV